jgi:hypothetical protein
LVFEVGWRGKAAYSPRVLETPSMGFSVFFKFDWFLFSRGGSLAALRTADLKWGAYSVTKPATSSRRFFNGIPRSSELGSATNEKTQAFGPGFDYLVDNSIEISNISFTPRDFLETILITKTISKDKNLHPLV